MQEFEEMLYRDVYCREFDTVVEKCEQVEDGYWILLEDTIFYPEGGGQCADCGTLNGRNVLDVQRRKDGIYHLVDGGFAVGETVHCVIDWQKRFENMQSHSGEHMVSGLIHQQYGYENIGFHMGSEVIQIDFEGALSYEQAMTIENQVNALIYRNLSLQITYPSKEELHTIPYRSKKELTGNVRIVTIPECDICACCGTHVKSTGEIGIVKILSVTKQKHGVRLEMVAGNQAYRYLSDVYEQNKQISVQLSAPVKSTADALHKLLSQQELLRGKYKQLQKTIQQMKIAQYEYGQRYIVEFVNDYDRPSMISYCNDLLEHMGTDVVCICNEEENGYSFIMMSKVLDLQSVKDVLREKLLMSGGGKKDVLQGRFQAEKDEITLVLEQFFESK